MKSKILFLGMLSMALLMGSCSDDDMEFQQPTAGISVAEPQLTDIGSTYASLSTDFVLLKGSDARYTNAGYCYSTSGTPTVHDSSVKATVDGNNNITVTLTGLAPSTTYYVRAFVNEYQGELIYSGTLEFKTAEGSLDEQLKAYKGPSYDDYYVNIAGWSDRHKWNLANVHDPTVMKADDGYFYMYQTDASYGNAHTEGGHFHGRRSKDLINWEYLGGTMGELPGWVVPKLNEIRHDMGLPDVQPDANAFGYWAPAARNMGNGLYRMYYSIVVPGYLNGENSWGERAFIGMMETNDPADNGSWVDKGYVITNASDRGLDFNVTPNDWANCYYKFNAIDPSYVVTPEGAHWLVYGSWNSGIAAVEIDPASGMPAKELGKPWGNSDAEISAYGKLIATRGMGNRWQASEGPEIIYRDGYYYLFLAYDELSVAYNTRVVRSKSITGPYLGIDGKDVTNNGGEAYPVLTHPYKFAGDHGWVGIAHCAVFDDGNGNWFYASQGRFPAGYDGNEFSNALMMGHVRAIRWTEDGWPLVMPERYGAVPQVPVTEDEIAGSWEHIDLSYSFGNQKESSPMVFNPDHTITEGVWKGGSWSFDEASQTLTANGVKLYLQRECDWESPSRNATIVYAGLNGVKTYWGKKSR